VAWNQRVADLRFSGVRKHLKMKWLRRGVASVCRVRVRTGATISRTSVTRHRVLVNDDLLHGKFERLGIIRIGCVRGVSDAAGTSGEVVLFSASDPMAENKRDTTIQKVLARNKDFALNYDAAALSPQPQMRLVVIACMDTRITLAALGLKPQDAHFIRNAGGIVTDDVLRSLLVSHYFLGTNEVMVINHTDCGLMKASEDEMHRRIEKEAGVAASSPVRFYAFSDVEKNVREQLEKLNAHSWVREGLTIRGFVFDVRSGKLKEVVPER
jgi:carbonic anhydrase